MDQVIRRLRDMTECPVCLEQFKEPRTLPCQHSFCTECLQGLLGNGRKIKCPCCNKETPVPNGVRELPVDFRANSWLEILSEYESAKAARDAAVEGEAAAAVQTVHRAEATALSDTFEEVMFLDERCPACQKIPTMSTKLSCGHSLCRNCVQFLLPVGGNTLHCPTCSRQTRINMGSYQVQRENASAHSRLTFHPDCGKNVVIYSNQITAHRKNPLDCLYDALVLTSRHLKPDEIFQVRLEKRVDKWSGSLHIGVTTKSPTEAAGAAYIFELGSGTCCMVGNVVWHKEGDEWTKIKKYKQTLWDLKVGYRVGVMRTEIGDLHFYINGADLGVAAHNVPLDVYGVVGIEADVQQVTIIQSSGISTRAALQ